MSSVASADRAANIPELPLEILHEVARTLSDDLRNDAEATAVQAFKNCSLANRSFAAAFHSYVFHNAFVAIGDDPENVHRAKQKLDIITSFPHLKQHVKHLTLSLSGACGHREGATSEVFSSFLDPNSFPTLHSLEVVGERGLQCHFCPNWYHLAEYLKAAIRLISSISTLSSLAFFQIDAVPVSLASLNQTITSLSLKRSSLMFVTSQTPDRLQIPSTLPISLNVYGMDFWMFDNSNMVNRAPAFFSRVRVLTGSTTWDTDNGDLYTFNTFLSALARMSPLECLDMTVSVVRPDAPSQPNAQAMEPFTLLRGLQEVTLSSDRDSDPDQFISSLSRAIDLLDTSCLEHLSVRISNLGDISLATMYNSSPFIALNGAIATKWANRQFEKLEELSITMEAGDEIVLEGKGAKEAARGAGFLSSLPEEKVRIVLLPLEA